MQGAHCQADFGALGCAFASFAAVLGQVQQGRLRKTQTGPWKNKEISKEFVGYA